MAWSRFGRRSPRTPSVVSCSIASMLTGMHTITWRSQKLLSIISSGCHCDVHTSQEEVMLGAKRCVYLGDRIFKTPALFVVEGWNKVPLLNLENGDANMILICNLLIWTQKWYRANFATVSCLSPFPVSDGAADSASQKTPPQGRTLTPVRHPYLAGLFTQIRNFLDQNRSLKTLL